jgi:hypothetical protein
MSRLRNPLVGSLVIASVLVLSAFAAITAGWHGSATTLSVAEQLTYFLSGGMAGVAMLATATTVALVQRQRRTEALERDVLARVVDAVMQQQGSR